MRILTGQRLNIEKLVFSPDGQFIACNGGTPSPLKWKGNVWQVSGDGKPKETVGDRVGGVSFTPDSRFLRLYCPDMWLLLDLEKGGLSPDIALGKLVADEVTDDGRWAITSSVSPEGGMLHLRLAGSRGTRWKEAWKRDLQFRGDGTGVVEAWESFSGLRLAANGARILLEFMFYFREDEPGQPVHRVLDTATGKQVFEWRGYRPSDASPLLISPQERVVYLLRDELHMIDPFAPDSARVIRHGTSRKHFTAAAFSPNGKLLATTSNDTTVTMWDTSTWQPIRQYGWEIGKLRAVAFAPDGLTCAAGSDTGKVVLFDVDG